MPRGKIKTIKPDRAFGFISQPGGPDLFFHRSACLGFDFDMTCLDRRVEFDTEAGPDGRVRAVNVRATN